MPNSILNSAGILHEIVRQEQTYGLSDLMNGRGGES